MKAKSKKQKAKGKTFSSSLTPNSELQTPNFFEAQSSVLSPFCAVLLALLLGFPAHAQNGATAPKKLNPYTSKTEAIAEGQQLYKKFNCYGCHGMQGGGGMGPNLTDETWQTGDGSDLNVLSQVRDGKGQMPAYKMMMNDDQAWKVIAFVRTLYKGDLKKVNW